METKFTITHQDDSFEKTMDEMMLPENIKLFNDKFNKLIKKSKEN